MGVNSLIEFFTTLFGWIMYDNIMDVLQATMLVIVPFILILVRNLVEGIRSPYGIAPIVKSIELQVGSTLLAYMLAVVPLMPLELSQMNSSRVELECGATTGSVGGEETHTTYDATFAGLGNKTAMVPVIWGITVQLSAAITAAATTQIPCSADLRGFQMRLDNERISDPAVRRETQEFLQQCYRPAVASIQQQVSAGALSNEDLDQLTWMGSDYLLSSPEYNNAIFTGRLDWPRDEDRDHGYPGPEGHPTCAQWWQGWGSQNDGLRERLVAAVDPALMQQATSTDPGGLGGFFDLFGSNANTEDAVLRSVLGASDDGISDEVLNNDYSQGNTWLASDGLVGGAFNSALGLLGLVGGAMESTSHFPKMMLLREALPIGKAFILMAIYMFLPFLLLLSGYRWGIIATGAIAIFAVHFLDFIWGVAFWMDNHMVEALQASTSATLKDFLGFGEDGAVDNMQLRMVLDFMTSVLYIGLPFVWLSVLGWAGFNVGGAVNQFMTNMTQPVGEAGRQGFKPVAKAANKVWSKLK